MITKQVQIKCSGRGPKKGQKILKKSINVIVKMSKDHDSDDVYVSPENCPFNIGGHGEQCKASHPNQNRVENSILCPFSFDYPYVIKNCKGWTMPTELEDALQEIMKIS